MPDYIAQYRIYLEQEKHASANTVSSYIRDVTQFCAWLPEGSDLRRVKSAAVSDYLTYLTDRGRSAATVIRSAASIKSFYNYLVVSDAMKAFFRPMDMGALTAIPYLGKLLFNHSLFTYLGIVLAIAAGWYLNHTAQGLNLRAVGENPAAADAAGVNVSAYKYVHILLGGGICGLGGAYIALVTCGGNWTYNCVGGLGWIAVALVIFAAWSPYKALLGSLVFGALSVLKIYIPTSVINIPSAFFSMLPFLVTCVILVISSIRMRRENQQPHACGVNYFREER